MRTARLGDGDSYAPFRFDLGDEVIWSREVQPYPEMCGVVVDGFCEYQDGGGAYTDVYWVRRNNGTFFRARSLDLMRAKEARPLE